MGYKNIQEILPLVGKPSRYLGCEFNTIKKDKNNVDLRFCLAFPDLYEIGTSHFGMQILYHILNSESRISAERVFAPDKDMESCLRNHGKLLTSLESGTPLLDFDIVGFSLLYELNYTNILTILDLSGISFFSSERNGRDPFVIAGGPCTCNPEPVADFFDAMVVGDGEQVILELARTSMKWKKQDIRERKELLEKWSEIDGVYIPSLYRTTYNTEGFQVIETGSDLNSCVKRTVSSSLENCPFPDAPVVPFGRPVHDRLRLEIARGCTRGCRFCQAGMIYRPVRERSVERIVDLAGQSIRCTGYDDISLLSLSTGDYSQLDQLMTRLFCHYELQNVAVSIPSFRAGTLTPDLMNLIKSVRKTGFTIAPEAGSQRLRNVINKNISEQEISNTVEQAFSLGWNVIKLYFMVGLPTETDEDLMEIVRMVRELSRIKGPGKKKKIINVSITTFIPKPHTPFQWEKQISSEESRTRFYKIHENLKEISRIRLKWQNQEMSQLEGLFARGDRRLSQLLLSAYKKGCRLDGWTEEFHVEHWREAFEETCIDIDFITGRKRDTSEPLPWDHIDIGVSKTFLINELERAVKGETVEDCRHGECNQCGVCDFEKIEPELSLKNEAEVKRAEKNGRAASQELLSYEIVYEKRGMARFFGHLEMVNIFIRAIKRAGLNVKYTEGFHPKPKISFSDPIPLGMESLGETLRITMVEKAKPDFIIEELNSNLPEGLKVYSCVPVSKKPEKVERIKSSYYDVMSHNPVFSKNSIESFLHAGKFFIEKSNPKGGLKNIDLKDIILEIELVTKNRIKMEIREGPGKTVRPLDIVKHIFKLPETVIKQLRVVKTPWNRKNV